MHPTTNFDGDDQKDDDNHEGYDTTTIRAFTQRYTAILFHVCLVPQGADSGLLQFSEDQ